MSKISLTPSKPVSAGSIVVLIFFLIFGIGFAFLVGNVLAENEAPALMSMVFYLFIFIWIGTVLLMLIYYVKNYNSEKGISILDINTEEESAKANRDRSPSERLRELELLKKESLITDKEYELKRTEILSDKW
ncbi:MAG TPA: hypothetical protein DHV28_17530 [Ignavibacteriales bacterium]|nr:hypothetical protein [Ignavibacteriales bacterium]